MKVHVFGDSHVDKFGQHPMFTVGYAGPVTAHNLCMENSATGGLKSLRRELGQNEGIVLFALGEIDCRIHLYYQHKKTGRSLEDLARETVARYGSVIKETRDSGRRVAVLDIPPAVAERNKFGYEFYGKRRDRAEIAWLFNNLLGQWCEINGIYFVRLYPHIADERGCLKSEYAAADRAHVTAAAVPFVVTELLKKFPELGTRLNLGCGMDLRDGFINIDCRPLPGVVVRDVGDTDAMEEYRGADYILAADVIEHFPREQAWQVLALWADLLAPGGTLEIWCPDIRWAVEVHDDLHLEQLLYGHQDYAENFHRCGFTLATMTALLTGLGMRIVDAVNTETGNLKVIAVK